MMMMMMMMMMFYEIITDVCANEGIALNGLPNFLYILWNFVKVK
jgi:hypothetical protein